MSEKPPGIAIVEPNIAVPDGHWAGYVLELALAAKRREQKFILVCEGEPVGALSKELLAAEVVVLARVGFARLRPLFVVACGLNLIFRVLHRRWPHCKYPYQFLLVARGLTEADNVRRARRAAAGPVTVVLTTASEALAGMVGLLSNAHHVRVVHDVYSWHSPLGRLLNWSCRSGLGRVRIICTTEGVRQELAVREPAAPIKVRTFALAGHPGRSRPARGDQRVRTIGVFGAWHRWKDADTIVAGASQSLQLTTGIQFIVAGCRLPGVHALVAGSPLGAVRVLERPLAEHELRMLYSECDAVLVCRKPGVVKESGLIMDAARYGVHLICSDHDFALTNLLRNEKWVTLFVAGNVRSLADVLVSLAVPTELPLPDPGAESRLGMGTAESALDFYAAQGCVDFDEKSTWTRYGVEISLPDSRRISSGTCNEVYSPA
jgi:glycosyltransferase involved in cell wall biosynthesis